MQFGNRQNAGKEQRSQGGWKSLNTSNGKLKIEGFDLRAIDERPTALVSTGPKQNFIRLRVRFTIPSRLGYVPMDVENLIIRPMYRSKRIKLLLLLIIFDYYYYINNTTLKGLELDLRS